MIEEDFNRVEKNATKCTYRLSVGFERCEDKGEKSALKFIHSSIYLKEEETIKSTKAHYPSNQSHLSTQREKQGKKPTSRGRKPSFVCFVAVLVTWMSFTSGVRKLREGVMSMLETHIVMSSLISRLVLTLIFCLAFTLGLHLALLHMLFLSSLMDLTIAHMVLVHERTALNLDALVMAHILMVIVSRVGLIFLLEGPTPTLSRDTWMVHIFPVVVHVPLRHVVRCKGL
jgi:hypothetical protein